ncbi:MAG: ACT domain-containing protein [Firmicutes bacterium]|nr:ACT domain-containing protein [Bacillota bacterium]
MSTSNKPRKNRVIVSVLGQDRVGIIAAVAQILSTHNINILDISQTIMQDLFTMILIADMEMSDIDLATLKDLLQKKGEELGLKIDVQHEDVFRFMHRI